MKLAHLANLLTAVQGIARMRPLTKNPVKFREDLAAMREEDVAKLMSDIEDAIHAANMVGMAHIALTEGGI